jgi:hypothetical protein
MTSHLTTRSRVSRTREVGAEGDRAGGGGAVKDS